MITEYEDFEIEVLPDGDVGEKHRVQVRCDQGRSAQVVQFKLTASAPQMGSISRAVARSARPAAGSSPDISRDLVGAVSVRSNSHAAELEKFGAQLFDMLLPTKLRDLYMRTRAVADSAGKGTRIRLRIDDPAIAQLPWELLHDDGFLCLSEDTPVVRYPSIPRRIRPLETQLPLKILAVLSSPPSSPLDVKTERQRVTSALDSLIKSRKVDLHWVEGRTPADLQEALRKYDPHILHFAGHGAYGEDGEEGQIFLQGLDGTPVGLGADDLATLSKGSKSLRVVFLNSCDGARESHNAFSSTASQLIEVGVPCVLAMQFQISDSAAITFSEALYRELAAGRPVDAAVSEARLKVKIGKSFEWSTPVLYLLSDESSLFRLKRSIHPNIVKAAIAVAALGLFGAGINAATSNGDGPKKSDDPKQTDESGDTLTRGGSTQQVGSSGVAGAETSARRVDSDPPPVPFDFARWYAEPCEPANMPPADNKTTDRQKGFREALCKATKLIENKQPCGAVDGLEKLAAEGQLQASALEALSKQAKERKPYFKLEASSPPTGTTISLKNTACADVVCPDRDITSLVGGFVHSCPGDWRVVASAPRSDNFEQKLSLVFDRKAEPVTVVMRPAVAAASPPSERSTTIALDFAPGSARPTSVKVDGNSKRRATSFVPVEPGTHEVVAEWPDGLRVPKKVTVLRGSSSSVFFNVTCKAPPSGVCTNHSP